MGKLSNRLYGVSFGDGNNGVSHMFADYYVRTCDPYRLALAAMVDTFKPEYMAQMLDLIEIDGEADYTVSATIFDDPEAEMPEDEDDYESGPCWSICEVFPEDAPRDGVPLYDSLEEALTDEALALVPVELPRFNKAALANAMAEAEAGHPILADLEISRAVNCQWDNYTLASVAPLTAEDAAILERQRR